MTRPLLQVERLAKHYDGTRAVDDLTFRVDEGRCVGLLGANGAGKTTTLRMLAGLLTPSAGTIRFAEGDGGDIRDSIGYLPQYPAFPNWMSSLEFLVYAGRLARLPKAEATARARETLERVGLKDAAKRRVGGYSGGMKQRLGIAQAIVHRPKLLVLDEPVSALDPLGRRDVLELMQELRKETTIVLSTHLLHDAESICDDVLILQDGRLAINGELSAILTENRQAVLHVKLSAPREAWVRSLSGRPYVAEVQAHATGLEIRVDDLEHAKAALLRDIADNGIPIDRFEVGQPTLEDLFLKAVRP